MREGVYFSLTVDLQATEAERLEDFLMEHGALGLEIRDQEAPPMPGVRGPAPNEAIVVAFFDQHALAAQARDEIQESFHPSRVELLEVVQQDWSTSWRTLIKSTRVGKLWVGPPWLKDEAAGGLIPIIIEPKMAFGTGDHPTTALCLSAVHEFLDHHPRASVLDVGTGTGVLALASKKLGAGRVVGIDNDDMSVTLARENASTNGVSELELSGAPLSRIEGHFDLVVANILANTLCELAPQIVPKVGTRLSLSGILSHQAAQVTSCYQGHGLTPLGQAQDGQWVRLDFQAS